MATTSAPIGLFVVGLRDSAGAVVPSGKVRFYQPGTLVQQTVYSDAACSTAYPQPITLNAYGQATIYTLEAVRCIAKDSTEATTYYDDVVNLVRADSTYLTIPGINSGNETTLEAVLALIQAGIGSGFQYQWKGNTGATARPYTYAIGEICVNVKDFGAVGDDSTDDTAAINTAIVSGAGTIYFPIGTYKITSKLYVTLGNTTIKLVGEGRGRTIIKNYSTTGDAIDLTSSGLEDYRWAVRDLTISANTSSSGRAIYIPSTVGVVIERVTITGHTTGIYCTGGHLSVRDCNITYTGTTGASYGIYAGQFGRIASTIVTGAGTAGSDTGVFLTGNCTADTVEVTQTKTAFSLSTGDVVTNGFSISNNVGYAVAAAAVGASLISCNVSSCTTDLSIGASVTNLNVIGCPFATYSGSASSYRQAAYVSWVTATAATSTATFTPDFTNSCVLQVYTGTYAAGAMALTIANPTLSSSMLLGTIVYLQLVKTGANAMNLTWGAGYLDADASAFNGVTSVASNTDVTIAFRVAGSGNLVRLMVGAATAV